MSSDLGALPQIVEHGRSGYLCDPSDIESMAYHLGQLLSSPQTCRDFGERGYKRVQEVLNWDSVGKVGMTPSDLTCWIDFFRSLCLYVDILMLDPILQKLDLSGFESRQTSADPLHHTLCDCGYLHNIQHRGTGI